MRKVLLVEDDGRLAAMLVEYLAGRDFAVTRAGTLAAAARLLKETGFDIMILDLMLPDGDGIDFCRAVRAESNIPIVMLTARGEAADKVTGLEIGADDYLSKPFDPGELAARLRAALRRATPENRGGAIRFADVVVNLDAMEARKNGEKADLTARQFAILRALLERAGKVVSRETLMDAAAGAELEAFDRSIDVHISRIRAALEDNPKKPTFIKTIRGEGYIFSFPPAGAEEKR
jgi:DNA-binding response OmpR family regulator